jgi:hypothetical protein
MILEVYLIGGWQAQQFAYSYHYYDKQEGVLIVSKPKGNPSKLSSVWMGSFRHDERILFMSLEVASGRLIMAQSDSWTSFLSQLVCKLARLLKASSESFDS